MNPSVRGWRVQLLFWPSLTFAVANRRRLIVSDNKTSFRRCSGGPCSPQGLQGGGEGFVEFNSACRQAVRPAVCCFAAQSSQQRPKRMRDRDRDTRTRGEAPGMRASFALAAYWLLRACAAGPERRFLELLKLHAAVGAACARAEKPNDVFSKTWSASGDARRSEEASAKPTRSITP